MSDYPKSGVNDNWKRAAAYNLRKRSNGQFTDQEVSQFVEYFQRNQGFKDKDVDGMKGTMTTDELVDVVKSWGEIPVTDPFAGWCYPMPILMVDGVEIIPDVSSGFGKDGKGNPDRKNHWGVDIMYRRHDNDDGPQKRYPPGHRYAGMRMRDPIVYSPLWYCPYGVECVAVGPGTIWSANWGANNNIKIDHHDVPGYGPLCTWYQHLHDIYVKPGDEVKAGDVIGIIGAGSSDLIHLHFEWRDHNRGSDRRAVVVDPKPLIAPFKKLTF